MVGMMVLGVGGVEGQSIFENPITGTNPNTDNPYTTGQIVDPNITVSGIGRGSGINGTNANDRYNANTWNAASLDADKYFYFILTPNSGYEIDFASFVYTGQASGTGPTSFAFRSSVDGFASNIGLPTVTGATISLTGTEYQNITSPIEFRLYGWGASGSGGTFSVNDFEFNGSVNFVCPPPTTQATTFDATNLQSPQMDISWTRGDGDNVLVLARQDSPVNADPVDGVSYTANAAFGSGQEIGSGNFVVYSGSGTGVTVTGLAPNTTYHYAIYEYNSGDNCYLKPGLTGNAATPPPPSLSVNPATLSGFTYVFGAGPSASQSYNLSGANLFPASGSIQIVAPPNYEVSPNNSAYTNSYDASYSGGTINTTIFVRLKAGLAVGDYNGEIVANTGGGASTQSVTCNGTVTMPPITLVYSQNSGSWTASNIWNTASDGSGFAVTDPNAPSISVVIQSGHTITLPFTRPVANFTVESGASIVTNQGTNRYIEVYGSSITIDGNAGGSGDGLSIDVNGPACSLSGAGSIQLSRLRKDNDAGASTTTNLIIENCVVNLSWSGSGALYNDGSAGATAQRTFNVTIASSATVNTAGDVVIDGATGTGQAWNDGTFTINGELNIGGNLLVSTGNPAGGNVNYIINGTVQVAGAVFGAQGVTNGVATANLIINGGGVLRLTGSNDVFTALSGSRETFTFNTGSTVDYAGGAAQNLHPFTYANLTSSGGGNKTAIGNTTVNGTLNLQSGNITLNPNTLTVATSGAIAGGSTASYVVTNGTGRLKRNGVGATAAFFPIGDAVYFTPVTLSNAGTADNFAAKFTQLYPVCFTTSAQQEASVVGTWEISEDAPGGSNCTISIDKGSVPTGSSFSILNATIAHCQGTDIGHLSGMSSGTTVTGSGFTTFSPFGIGNAAVLPIELLTFDARQQGQTALLTWRTASEQDNDYMAVERSADGRAWAEIGRVTGAGTTAIPQDYRFVDERPLPRLNYYRLRQVDFDGTYEYHRTVALDFRVEGGGLWQIFPSLAGEMIQVRLAAPSSQEARVAVVNLQGQVLLQAALPAGPTELQLDVARLPAGLYAVLIQRGGQRWVERFVKE
jgi:hypothetical protein